MTNIEAYKAWFPFEQIGIISLGEYSIDPDGTTDTQVSAAIGMIDKAMSANYTQGSTSETLTDETRANLISRGRNILKLNDIEYHESYSGLVCRSGGRW